MAAPKRKTARKSTASKTQAKATNKATSNATDQADSAIQTTDGTQSGPVRVEAGGIDPRLVEERERRRAEEGQARVAPPQPATIDPRLEEIREQTIKREAELANRSTTEPPARG